MKRLDYYIKSRHEIASNYDKEFANIEIVTPYQPKSVYSSYHLYPIRINQNLKFQVQKKIYSNLREKKILVNLHYAPVHLQPYYEKLGFKKNEFPEAEIFHRETITLPMFPILSRNQQNYVIESLISAIRTIQS